VSTILTAHADCTSLKESLAALQAGQDKYAQFVSALLSELEATQQKLVQAETQIDLQSRELVELRNRSSAEYLPPADNAGAVDQALQNKVTELENDRQALEEELENIRARAVDMAQTIADQKRQMTEDQSQWMAEFRQLRRILDKQTKWITQQNEPGGVPRTAADAVHCAETLPVDETFAREVDSNDRDVQPSELVGRAPASAANTAPQIKGGGNNADPVLGSVLSQFEFLQKDVARRRKQGGNDRPVKKAMPPERLK
jgi:hypothetical protein